jgi:CO/xanthine dehydrogenase Mo-binding subunit
VGAKACLETAAELIGFKKPAGAGEGVGLSCAWWFSFPAASSVDLKVNVDGSATLVTGAQENGSGAVMGLALIAAEELGISPDRVSILYQDTDAGAWDMGSSGSQTTFNNGRAVIAAAAEVRKQILSFAAEKLEASAEDLEIVDGVVRVRGVPGTTMPVADVAGALFATGHLLTAQGAAIVEPLPENFGASCSGRVVFPAFADPTFTCQAARVVVDRATGVARVVELVAAHDFGKVLNPDGARGQVEGGVVHSIGMALTEGTVYREGKQVNPHLLDYKLQTAADAPAIRVEFVETFGAAGPRGGKGVGEPPIIAAAGAVGNAIATAVGARVRQLPMTPPRIWAALNASGKR